MSEKYSESEEMYLASIASLGEGGLDGPIPISRLAEVLSVQPVSAYQMVQKLSDYGLVTYIPYRGVSLTENGRAVASNILRHRRLWEVFLVDRLQFSLAEASPMACRLEHTLPSEAAEQLAAFLDQPEVSPGGLRIPAPGRPSLKLHARPASRLQPGESGLVVEIAGTPTGRDFLDQQGIRAGQRLFVLAAGSGNVLVQSESGQTTNLSKALADAVLINRHSDWQEPE